MVTGEGAIGRRRDGRRAIESRKPLEYSHRWLVDHAQPKDFTLEHGLKGRVPRPWPCLGYTRANACSNPEVWKPSGIFLRHSIGSEYPVKIKLPPSGLGKHSRPTVISSIEEETRGEIWNFMTPYSPSKPVTSTQRQVNNYKRSYDRRESVLSGHAKISPSRGSEP